MQTKFNRTKSLVSIFWFICYLLFTSSVNLSAQVSPLDSLSLDSKSFPINQKIELKNNIQNFLEKIELSEKRLALSQKYFEAAIANQDSFFLAHSSEQLAIISAVTSDTFKYHLEGNKLISKSALERIYLQENISYLFNFVDDKNTASYFERHQIIKSDYGIHTSELPTERKVDLYNALKIYKADHDNISLKTLLESKILFEYNNTLTDFDPKSTYWLKLKLRGGEQQIDTCSFFVENMEGYASWNTIEAYLVHEDGQVEKQRTGNLLPIEEKSFPIYNNIVRFELSQMKI